MSVLKNTRHEKFALLVSSGKTQADAYRTVFPASKKWKTGNAVDSKASSLAAKVRQRIDELLEASAARASITKDEVVAFLADAIRTPVGDIDEKNKLAQEVDVTTLIGDGIRIKTKSVSKMQAAELLSRLLGWNAPVKQELDLKMPAHDDVQSLLKERLAAIRSKKK